MAFQSARTTDEDRRSKTYAQPAAAHDLVDRIAAGACTVRPNAAEAHVGSFDG